MTHRPPIQLPLRRAYLLSQNTYIQSLVLTLMYVEGKKTEKQIARYMGVSQSLVSRRISQIMAFDWLSADTEEARRVLANMENPLYATSY